MIERFDDRTEGGRALAARLLEYKDRKDVVVMALPRGGVPVAFEVARILGVPLDILMVRKLGVPGQEELAFGAIAPGGIAVLQNESLLRKLNIPSSLIERVIEREKRELERREKAYRMNSTPLDLEGKICIVVDDGLATGATMRAAILALRMKKPSKVIVAAPIASEETCEAIRLDSDDLCICARLPEPFYGVGMWYRNFDQTTDEEVIELLRKAKLGRDENAAVR